MLPVLHDRFLLEARDAVLMRRRALNARADVRLEVLNALGEHELLRVTVVGLVRPNLIVDLGSDRYGSLVVRVAKGPTRGKKLVELLNFRLDESGRHIAAQIEATFEQCATISSRGDVGELQSARVAIDGIWNTDKAPPGGTAVN